MSGGLRGAQKTARRLLSGPLYSTAKSLLSPSSSLTSSQKPSVISLLNGSCRQLTSGSFGRVWEEDVFLRTPCIANRYPTLPPPLLNATLSIPLGCRSLATSPSPPQQEASSPPPPPPHHERSTGSQVFTLAAIGMGICAYYYLYAMPNLKKDQASKERREERAVVEEPEQTIANWSGTHEVRTQRYFQPESVADLEDIVKTEHNSKRKLRPVGSALSPNGIGLCRDGMVNMALLDRVVSIDPASRQVTVQAGARVAEVVEALRPHGLTLQNYASIREQQIGGFIQVSAHGTGASLPPADETVVSLKLVTPARGTITLSRDDADPSLFRLARCGLGALGVVAEVTLQCVPAHKLLEHTFVTDMSQIRKYHKDWLKWSQHVRYMWIPHTNAVVVVRSNPYKDGDKIPSGGSRATLDERLSPLRDLYSELASLYASGGKVEPEKKGWGRKRKAWARRLEQQRKAKNVSGGDSLPSEEEIHQLSFSELRDKILALDPLNKDLVVRANRAEAEYWRRSHGYRIGWSDEILGFDCGGQQWVSETCFPTGTFRNPNGQDLAFIETLLQLIRREALPAHTPIEQRWTAASLSPMSPASAKSPNALFSWVGIIMYLPTEDAAVRDAITQKFFEYRALTAQRLWDKYGAYEHWAKIEVPEDDGARKKLQERLRKRFPVDAFNAAREKLDPHNILANDVLDALFPREADNGK